MPRITPPRSTQCGARLGVLRIYRMYWHSLCAAILNLRLFLTHRFRFPTDVGLTINSYARAMLESSHQVTLNVNDCRKRQTYMLAGQAVKGSGEAVLKSSSKVNQKLEIKLNSYSRKTISSVYAEQMQKAVLLTPFSKHMFVFRTMQNL